MSSVARAAASRISSSDELRKTPTNFGASPRSRTDAAIAAARSGSTKRGVEGTKMKPRKSAPCAAAASASSSRVMPQILILVMAV